MRSSAWVAAGAAQILVATLAGVSLAAGSLALPPVMHVLLALLGFSALLGGIALGLSPPLVRRDPALAWLSGATLALMLLADLRVLGARVLGGDILEGFRLPAGLMLLALALHAPAAFAFGKRWDGVDVYADDQPFRRGDRLAAVALGVAAAGFLGSSILLLVPPRAFPSSAIVTLVGALLAALVGIFAFLLPRHARAPLPGVTLVGAALFLAAGSAASLAWAFVRGDGFRLAASSWLLGFVLAAVAFSRATLKGARAAKPLLASTAGLALLGGIALFLALAGDAPGPLTGAAVEAHLVLLGVGSCAALQLAAPLLWRKDAAPGAWTKVAPALAIGGVFLLAPAFQYDRSPFPGALLVALAFLLAALGLLQIAARK